MKKAVTQSLETVINRYLSLDPESAGRLAALEGKIITIELLAISLTLHLKISNKKIMIEEKDVVPDVIISGTPLALLRLSLSKQNRKKLFAEDVTIAGDLELGQQIIDLFDTMEIDWEEYLSHATGDVPAHQLGRFARGLREMAGRVRNSILQNINEYVHEEATLFPQREALNDFFNDIDLLRMDVDRLEARVKRLQQLHKDFL
jgi:ubiquinone biosynthesis protein UbiJ